MPRRDPSPPPAVRLSPEELDRRRDRVAVALVRTIHSVPMPGVAPLSGRDLLLIVALIATEAVVVGLVVAAPRP